VAVLCATAFALLASWLTASPAQAAADCHATKLIVIRGTDDEPADFGKIGRSINRYLGRLAEASGVDYGAHAIHYPADLLTYPYSKRQGRIALVQFIKNQVKACAHASTREKFLLLGYSQGAHVVGDALSKGLKSGLTKFELSQIKAVALVADPRFNSREPFDKGSYVRGKNGRLGKRRAGDLDAVSGRIRSWCRKGDWICQGGLRFWNHHASKYLADYREDIIRFFVSKLKWPFGIMTSASPYTKHTVISADASTVAWVNGTNLIMYKTNTGDEVTTSMASADFATVREMYLAPNGKHVAVFAQYIGTQFNGCRIMVEKIGGGRLHTIFPSTEELDCGEGLQIASADRKWLTICNRAAPTPTYYAVNMLTGSPRAVLAADPSCHTSFSFPSRGTTAVALTRDAAGTGLADHADVVHTDGSAATPLAPPAGYQFLNQAPLFPSPWSRTGNHVALDVRPPGINSGGGIVIIDASTGKLQALAERAHDVSFTSDGKGFAYWACDPCDGGHEAVWLADTDGGATARVSPKGRTFRPASPIVRTGHTFATETDPGHPTIFSFKDNGEKFGRAVASSESRTLAADLVAKAGKLFFSGVWHGPNSSAATVSVWRSRPDGSEQTRLVPANPSYTAVFNPLWWGGISADGSRVTGVLQLHGGHDLDSDYEVFTAYRR
jgi:acetylxylan esterase